MMLGGLCTARVNSRTTYTVTVSVLKDQTTEISAFENALQQTCRKTISLNTLMHTHCSDHAKD